jgi:hypothetical protein
VATQKRIAEAVDNEIWQEFRKSLKGLSTQDKLRKLEHYLDTEHRVLEYDRLIQVDNYTKALCRGGQLFPGESLQTVIAANWQPRIKS